MAAAYDASTVEADWYTWWEGQGLFKPPPTTTTSSSTSTPAFSMVLPPPNVTGALHIGHALTVAVQDAVVRWQRMQGHDVVWVPGLDHAGIATQTVVERSLARADPPVARADLTRDEFVEHVWAWYEQYGDRIMRQLRDVGASLDWSRQTFTMDGPHSEAVAHAFVQLYKDGLLYRRQRLVNWCPHLNTVISDIEVEVEQLDRPTKLRLPSGGHQTFGVMDTFGYRVVSSDHVLRVSTTRLETMLGDAAVAVHPDDPRYASLIGGQVVHPIHGTLLPIIADAELVDPELGTGVVKVTPAHDPNDLECGRRHGLPEVSMLNDDGTINAVGGPEFEGMDRFEARRVVQAALTAQGLFFGSEPHAMALARCSRSGDVLEPMLKPQWYVSCTKGGLAAAAANLVRNGDVVIRPSSQQPAWFRWLDNAQDWCVSRQLWWGHRVPAFLVSSPQHPQALDALRTAVQSSPSAAAADPRIRVEDTGEVWVVETSPDGAAAVLAAVCADLGVSGGDASVFHLSQDEDVLDTWFSSAVFPVSVFGWPGRDDADLRRFYPLDVMETGQDILFFWVARMAMLCRHLTGSTPFKEVWLHPLVRDAAGRKMSKSLGNVVDPVDFIRGTDLPDMLATLEASALSPTEIKAAGKDMRKQFPAGIPPCGADALRFTLASYMQQSTQINLDPARVVTHRQFCNKLWNASRFVLSRVGERPVGGPTHTFGGLGVSGLPLPPLDDLPLVDRWILSRLATAVVATDAGLSSFSLATSTAAIYKFVMDEFCEVYLEWSKHGADGDTDTDTDTDTDNASRAVLAVCLDGILRMAQPFMPFVSEELHQRLHHIGMDGARGEPAADQDHPSIMTAAWPDMDVMRAVADDGGSVADMDHVLACLRSSRSVLKTVADTFPGSKRKDFDVVLQAGPPDVAAVLSAAAPTLEFVLRAGKVTVQRGDVEDHHHHHHRALHQAAGTGATVVVPIAFDDSASSSSTGTTVAAAVERLRKKAAKLGKTVVDADKRVQRLKGDGRVPVAAVDKEQTRLDGARAALAAVEATIGQLGARDIGRP